MYEATSDVEARPARLGRAFTLTRGFATASVLGWSLVAVGIVVRLVRYGDNRALWHDEALLALNILERGFVDLLRPLDYLQAAPPLFLLLEKLAAVTLGPTEYALRLVPLLAGIASLVLFRHLALRILPGVAGLSALALFAVAEPLVYWSAEAKQYSGDVLAAVALLALAANPLLTGRLSGRRTAALAAAGGLAMFFSYASVFVLAGIAAALTLAPLAARRRPATAAVAVVAAWLLAVAAGLAVIALTAGDVRRSLEDFLSAGGSPLAVARDAWHAFGYPGPFAHSTTGVAVVLAALGVLHLARRHLPLLVALGITIAATALAAQLRVYPFFERFVLFLVPLLLLLVAAGLEQLREATAPRRAVWLAALAVVAAYPVGLAASNLVAPPKLEEKRDVLRPLEAGWRPGDALFVAELATPAVGYYAECRECGVLDGVPSEDLRRLALSARSPESKKGLRSAGRLVVGDVDTDVPLADVAGGFERLRGEPRAWILLSSGWNLDFVDYALGCLGRRVESFEATNAAAYLYDFSGPPDRSAGCARL